MISTNYMELLQNILKTQSINEIATKLNLSGGTIKRWIELNNIPKQYEFDLMKMSSIAIDYSLYSPKDKDQFFTLPTTAEYCYLQFKNKLISLGENELNYTYVEPSAGDGSFLNVLPQHRRIGMDVEPKNEEIIEQDYLTWNVSQTDIKYVVIGNPPFGLRGHLALRFINYSSQFADFVCFILPQLFESDGKGAPRKRVIGYNLIHSEKLQTEFYEPNNKIPISVNTIFQIWSKNYSDPNYEIKENTNTQITVFSMSDGGSSSSTRNKNMINCCDLYLPSTCFGKENMRSYTSFYDLPGQKGYGIVFKQNKNELTIIASNIEWSSVAFLSTNSAYNLRSSQIYSLIIM
jgi:hypothetical protein